MNALLFSLLALFWGGSFIAIKFCINYIPSTTAAFSRVALSFLFLLFIYVWKLKLPSSFSIKELSLVALTGLCSIGIPFSLLFYGEQFLSPSIAGIMNGTVPLWTLLISIVFLGEKQNVSIKKISGMVLSFLGILIIFFPKISLSHGENEIWGLCSLLGMAIFYAVGMNLNKVVIQKNKTITGGLNILLQQLFSMIFLLIMVFIFDGPPNWKSFAQPEVVGSLLYLSLFSTCFAYIILYRLIRDIGQVKAAAVTFFVPPISLLLDLIIFDRILRTYEIIGIIIILSSMYLLKDQKEIRQ